MPCRLVAGYHLTGGFRPGVVLARGGIPPRAILWKKDLGQLAAQVARTPRR